MLELFHFTKSAIDIELFYSSLMCIYIALEFLNVTTDTASEQGSARLQLRKSLIYSTGKSPFTAPVDCQGDLHIHLPNASEIENLSTLH
jgi:hypothetical protein